jgi:hypothetical protein
MCLFIPAGECVSRGKKVGIVKVLRVILGPLVLIFLGFDNLTFGAVKISAGNL